jgi:hypothetical protein
MPDGATRLVSLHDPDARPIRKGRIDQRSGGDWTQLGDGYSRGPLAAGTQLKLMVVGSTLSFLENGVERIAATTTA